MILARWRDRWFLASKVTSGTPSCALIAADWPGLENLGFVREEQSCIDSETGASRRWCIWHRFMPSMEGIAFYPEIRYKEMRVYPWNGWDQDSAEPLLNVMSGSYYAYLEESPDIAEARKRELLAEGWYDGGRDGVAGYVHVDKLEKIEGLPPAEAF